MMIDAIPVTRDLVLIGGGHTHALVLKSWGMNPLPGARLTVVNPGPTAPYSGMLPGYVAGHYDRDDLEIDVHRLARFAGARLILDRATGIDPGARTITLAERSPIAYDIASIDVGIHADMGDLPGFSDHAVPAKPLDQFADRWAAFRDGQGRAHIVIIGAGVGGVELSMAMAHALTERGRTPEITVIDARRALPGLPPAPRARLLAALADWKIQLLEDSPVDRVSEGAVHLNAGPVLPADFIVGAAGARPWPWLAETGLTHRDGFLEVDDTLRTSDPAIFAAGDCAHLKRSPRPKAGVYAVRAAPTLAHNLRADLSGSQRKSFIPQKDFVKLITLGRKSAVFEKWGIAAQGARLWTLKNRIDQGFMARLDDLKPMSRPAPPRSVAKGVVAELADGQPICAGCGGKIGAGPLGQVFSALPTTPSNTIVTGPGDDAAVVSVGETQQVITTDQLRAFTDDPAAFARIAALHALGDIWAMGATPHVALAHVTLPPMSETLQARTLFEVMDAAGRAFAEADAGIVGGHTAVGAELSIGFTVTGFAADQPITLAGAHPEDVLILTRPLGSGTLLAGDMALKTPGPAIAALMAELSRPQGPAAAILCRANAMTDVTGFGLAGHLMNLAEASGVAADITLDAVPVFEGALALAERGVRSTLYAANRARFSVSGISDTPRAALMFDPQTAGGLLAAVPMDAASSIIDDLSCAGFAAARIGRLKEGPPGLTLF
ncbi:MAG: selenide, water dikinase SelD [Pseudomonadota bacterium]